MTAQAKSHPGPETMTDATTMSIFEALINGTNDTVHNTEIEAGQVLAPAPLLCVDAVRSYYGSGGRFGCLLRL